MYANSHTSSPLSKATTALALQVAQLYIPCRDYSNVEHRIYAEALAKTNQAITGPIQSKSDELLMTTLVLDAYESNEAIFGKRYCKSNFDKHILGSVALLQHRGTLNYRDDTSRSLLVATRNRLLYSDRNRFIQSAGLEAVSAVWDSANTEQPNGVAIEADTLAFKLSRLQHLIKMNHQIPASHDSANECLIQSSADDDTRLQRILTSATSLVIECDRWLDTLPPTWRPIPVLGCSLSSSIKAAALYEKVIPTVYTNLSIANLLNRQRITQLGVLELIHKCTVARSAKSMQIKSPQDRDLPATLLAKTQILVDEICASVPYLTVDVSDKASVISLALPTPNKNAFCHWDTAEHRRQVAASGLYMMYGILNQALGIVGDMGVQGGFDNVIRKGQFDWMVRQSNRLRDILSF
ncbi:Ff.00g010890.m01.CDS01 [Fusarium sp. VM40]|nr:Ff.00g010890.m01.CDS01 [Fusarium sp. VM40]